MKYIKLAILAIALIISPLSFAYDFSGKQISNMQKAYKHGMSSQNKDRKYNQLNIGYIMAAIIWQESSCGMDISNGHAVGAFQNYIPTVKSRMKQQGINRSSAQIKNELMNFNTSATWASVELDSWLKTHKGDMRKALAGYNAGYKTNAGMGYSSSVIRKATYLKSNNVLKVE